MAALRLNGHHVSEGRSAGFGQLETSSSVIQSPKSGASPVPVPVPVSQGHRILIGYQQLKSNLYQEPLTSEQIELLTRKFRLTSQPLDFVLVIIIHYFMSEQKMPVSSIIAECETKGKRKKELNFIGIGSRIPGGTGLIIDILSLPLPLQQMLWQLSKVIVLPS